MKELSLGPDRSNPRRVLPDDAEVFAEEGAYRIQVSGAEECFIVETVSYHPGPLLLSRDDLVAMLARLDTLVEQRQKRSKLRFLCRFLRCRHAFGTQRRPETCSEVPRGPTSPNMVFRVP
jgi:hypothetical protein